MIRALIALIVCGFVSVAQAAPQPRSNGGCHGGPNLPLDAGVSGITSAYGTCALTKNWLNRHFADVVSNGVTYTINFINGAPDTRRLAQLMGNINPNFGVGGLPLAKWYDQSGNGNDCSQSVAANRMVVWLVNGSVYITTDGYFFKYITNGTTQDLWCQSSTGTYNSQASTFYFAGIPVQMGAPAYTSGGAGIMFQTGSGCCGGAAGAGWTLGGSGSNGGAATFFSFSWDGFATPSVGQLWPESGPTVIGAIFGPSVISYTQNEETPISCTNGSTSCPLAAQTATGLKIGADDQTGDAGAGAYVRFQAMLGFGATALSSGNQTTIRNSLYQLFNIPKTQNYSVIIDGASFDIQQGGNVGGISGLGWSELMRSRFPYPIRFVNMAVSGATIANLNTAWNTLTSFPCTGTFSKTILIGPNSAPGNSIAGGSTGAQAFADLQTYLTTVKSKCTWSAIIVVTLSTGGDTSGPNFDYNALVRANAGSLGITVAEWATDPVMGPNSNLNPVLYNQVSPYGLHPTVAGHYYLSTDVLGPTRAAIGQ